MDEAILLLILGIVACVTFLRPQVGLYVMVFLTPIQYYLVTTSGATLIRYIGWITFVAWGAHKLLTKSRFTSLSPMSLLLPIFIFLYLCLISFAWSSDTTWQTSIFSFVQLIIWVILILDLIDSQQRLERLFIYLSIGVMISAFILLTEFLTKPATWAFSTIAEGGFGDRNTSAASYIYVLPFFFLLLQKKGVVKQIVAIISIAFLVTAVGVSVSRTNLLVLPIALFLMSTLTPSLGKRLKYFLLVIVILAVTIPFWPWEQLEYRYSNAWSGGQNQDLGGRIGTWSTALDQLVQQPLLGRGLGRYINSYTTVAHNMFLEIGSQLGIFGLLLSVWIWIATWQHLIASRSRAKNAHNNSLAGLIAAVQISAFVYLIFSFVHSTESHRLLWLTFALAGVCHRLSRDTPPITERPGENVVSQATQTIVEI